MSRGRTRTIDHQALIDLKNSNKYIPASAAITILKLNISTISVHKIWQKAKLDGKICY